MAGSILNSANLMVERFIYFLLTSHGRKADWNHRPTRLERRP